MEDYVFLLQGEPALLALENAITNQISKYLNYLTSFKVRVDFSNVDFNILGVEIKYSIDNLDVDEVASFIVGPEVIN